MDTAPSPQFDEPSSDMFLQIFPYSPIYSPIVWVTIIQYYLPIVQNSPACNSEGLLRRKLLTPGTYPRPLLKKPWFGNPCILVFWGIYICMGGMFQGTHLLPLLNYPRLANRYAQVRLGGWPCLLEGRCKDRRARQIHREFEVNLKWCGLVREL